jgi:hypothetical protein
VTDQAPPTVEGLQRQIYDLQLEAIKLDIKDHESRIRVLEEVATRFNFILYLVMGGGLVGVINLLGTVVIIYSKYGSP